MVPEVLTHHPGLGWVDGAEQFASWRSSKQRKGVNFLVNFLLTLAVTFLMFTFVV